jgi:hypothetical protein
MQTVTALCETGAVPQLLRGKYGKSRQQNPCTEISTLHGEKWTLLRSGARDPSTQCTGWMGSAETHAPCGKKAGWGLKSACREYQRETTSNCSLEGKVCCAESSSSLFSE